MILTHCPFDPTPHSGDWDPNDLGSTTYKGNAKYFGDMVSYMDFSIGRIVTQLDKLRKISVKINIYLLQKMKDPYEAKI